MAALIRNRELVQDSWQRLEVAADGGLPAVPQEGDVLVPLALWQRERAMLRERRGRTGVWLKSSEGPESLAPDIGQLPVIAIDFPKVTDGRGYSTGRLLRERYGYKGELRAIGDVQRDQLLFLSRCGFDAFSLKDGQNAEVALSAFREFSEAYQAGVDRPWPLFRRRGSAPAEVEWS